MLLPDSVTPDQVHAFAVLLCYLLLFLIPLNVLVTLWTLLLARSVRNLWLILRERRAGADLQGPELVTA